MDDIQYVLVLPLPTRKCIFLSDLRFRPVRFAPPCGEFRPLVMEVHQIHIIQCHHDKMLGNGFCFTPPQAQASVADIKKSYLLSHPNYSTLSFMLSRVLRTLSRHNLQSDLITRKFSCTVTANKMVCTHGGVV